MAAWIFLSVVILGIMACASFDQWMKHKERLERMRLQAHYGRGLDEDLGEDGW